MAIVRSSRSRTDRAAAALDAPVLRTLLSKLPAWRGVLVLNYHRVGDPTDQPWDRTLWSATREGFAEQLDVLVDHADVVAPADLPAVAARGRGRHVLLTFDDGYRDNWEVAFPLLRLAGLPATFFLATDFLDRPHVAWWDELAWMVRRARAAVVPAGGWLAADVRLDAGAEAAAAALIRCYKGLAADRAEGFLDHVAAATGAGRCPAAEAAELWMTWEMARELRDAGMTIGGHTVTHPVLARLPAAAQEEEVAGCARRLREELGEPMRWFSYPVGSRDAFTDETRAIVRRHGVELAFAFAGGYGRFDRWDPYAVPRIHVGPATDRRRLQAAIRLPQLFALPD